MSSFKRKASVKQQTAPKGTRSSPLSSSTILTSTGIPSLDDILGGGLPLTCSLLVLAPDRHSAYGELVQKYYISQGLASGHRICIVSPDAQSVLRECMWTRDQPPKGASQPSATQDFDDNDDANQNDEKISIAWRYEQMEKFRTTVSSSSSSEDYCQSFDLTCSMPEYLIQSALKSEQVVCIDICSQESDDVDGPLTTSIIRRLEKLLHDVKPVSSPIPLRVSIPSLGSMQWGDLSSQDILCFLHALRAVIRRFPNACVSVSLAPHLCTDTWGGPGWTQKLAWMCDGAVSFSAFSSDPSLSTLFPSHHGLFHIHTLPAPHTLLPPSDKLSTLRGLSSSGENNLAFKCTRKRLIIETLHLDVEGGTSERRTTPSSNAQALDAGLAREHEHAHETHGASKSPTTAHAAAAIEVQIDAPEVAVALADDSSSSSAQRPKKGKKKVAFQSDRPDLYDF